MATIRTGECCISIHRSKTGETWCVLGFAKARTATRLSPEALDVNRTFIAASLRLDGDEYVWSGSEPSTLQLGPSLYVRLLRLSNRVVATFSDAHGDFNSVAIEDHSGRS